MESEPSSNFAEEEELNEDNISYKSFNSSSFEPDFSPTELAALNASDINNDAKKLKQRQYMNEYMRKYRQKQKETKKEHSHCCIIRNKFYKDEDVINLLLNSLQRLVEIINLHSHLLSQDRIQRINERTNDVIAYGNLLIQTFDEIKQINN